MWCKYLKVNQKLKSLIQVDSCSLLHICKPRIQWIKDLGVASPTELYFHYIEFVTLQGAMDIPLVLMLWCEMRGKHNSFWKLYCFSTVDFMFLWAGAFHFKCWSRWSVKKEGEKADSLLWSSGVQVPGSKCHNQNGKCDWWWVAAFNAVGARWLEVRSRSWPQCVSNCGEWLLQFPALKVSTAEVPIVQVPNVPLL